MKNKVSNKKLSEQNWFIILMCIVFFPVGVVLLWINGKFSLATKTIITIIQTAFFSIFLAAVIAPFFMDIDSTNSNPTVSTPVEDNSIEYRVVEINESPYIHAKRYNWKVVIEGEVSKAKLEQVSREIIDEAKTKRPFNALTVFLYDHEEYINGTATLGQVTFAPNGDWGQADTVGMGEYDKMDYSYEVYEKDWSNKLTDSEAKIYGAYNETITSTYESGEVPDESLVMQNVGEQFNISPEEVNHIVRKQMEWANNL